VRKRLIQYYYDPSHAGEPVIEISAGSYVPLFRQSNAQRVNGSGRDSSSSPQETLGTEPEGSQEVKPSLAFPSAEANTKSSLLSRLVLRRPWMIGSMLAGALLLAGMLGFAIGRNRPIPSPSNIDLFWEPVVSSSNPTTYSLGEPDQSTISATAALTDTASTTPGDEQLQTRLRASGRMNMSDVLTLTRTTAPLASRHGTFRVLPASETTFTQLREGPNVLIGAFDNPWTLRITQGLRYGFEIKDGSWLIVDHYNEQQAPWVVRMNLPVQNLARDYAIVARIHDNNTGQPVIIVAGISDQGTEAASEVVYNPVYLKSLLDKAPKDWSHRNLEAVIGTHVIDGHPGPPDILALDTW